jgi:uncharacterized protein YjbI with pentapeptide repeats
MDRDEALRLLRGGSEGIAEWNRRRAEGEVFDDLSGADLREAYLFGADFREADLSGANLFRAHLSKANLFRAHLSKAHLSGANFNGANLSEADLSKADLSKAHLLGADLSRAYLFRADLREVNLHEADLSRASLKGANLSKARLIKANLSGANFIRADFRGAYLFKADLSGADLSRTDFRGADITLARLIRCKLDDAIFDDANVTDCQVLETIGRPKPPSLLRVHGRPPLTGEDARNFFNQPAIVEVYLTEILTDEELGAFRFHLGDMRRQGVAIGVHLTGEREEGGGTVLRFQAPTYAEIYHVLPILLKPFRMSRAVDWAKTYEALPEHERGGVLTALATVEVRDPIRRWLFAERMAQAFGNFPVAQIRYIRDNRSLDIRGVRIEVAINQAVYEELAPVRPQLVTKQQIINMLADGSPRIALEDHSVDIKAQGNFAGANVGVGNTIDARDINAFINAVDQSQGLDPEVGRALKEARTAIEASNLDAKDKGDAADELGKLADELKEAEPKPSRIKRLFESIQQLIPDAASILSSVAKICELIKG